MIVLLALFLAQHWEPIFDGKTLDGWEWTRGPANPIQPSWEIAEGEIRTSEFGVEVYLLSQRKFADFELSFEWNASRGANSGIKYRFQSYGTSDSGRIEPTGLEYQITDDVSNPDALSTPKHSCGALYEYIAPVLNKVPCKPGVWHEGRIVARGLHIEHWLDGIRVVNIDLDSAEAATEFAKSKRRSAPGLRKQAVRESPIALQFHDGEVRFRNLRVRRFVQ